MDSPQKNENEVPDIDIDDVIDAVKQLSSELGVLRQRFDAHEHKADGSLVYRN